MAMILAGAALLAYGDERAQQVGRAIREACLEAVSQGIRTADLGGHAGTTEFTDEVIRRREVEARGLGDALAGTTMAAALAERTRAPGLEKGVRERRVELRSGAALDLIECARRSATRVGRDASRSWRRTRRRRRAAAPLGNVGRRADRWDTRRRPSARGGTARRAARPEPGQTGLISFAPAAGCFRISASSCGRKGTALARRSPRSSPCRCRAADAPSPASGACHRPSRARRQAPRHEGHAGAVSCCRGITRSERCGECGQHRPDVIPGHRSFPCRLR